MTEIHELDGDGGDVVPLEPLTNRAGSGRHGISSIMRAAFNVLYEANEPLTVDEIARRSYDVVNPAARYHAKRAYIRMLEADRRRTASRRVGLVTSNTSPTGGVSLEHAWRQNMRKLLSNGVRIGTLLRDGDRYAPNPCKPPSLELVDGTRVRYTRDAWRNVASADRAVGDIKAMEMELERVLGGLDIDELRQAVGLVNQTYGAGNVVDPRTLRAKLRWLIDRPSTDAGRAWLLTELIRRAYG